MSKDITSIRLARGEKIAIRYRQQNKTDMTVNDEFSVTSWDRPRPELYEAMATLAFVVCEICGLPEEYAGGMAVTGLRADYGDDTITIRITAEKVLLNADRTLIISTPPMRIESMGKARNFISTESAKYVLAALTEAEKYADGDRAQIGLKL